MPRTPDHHCRPGGSPHRIQPSWTRAAPTPVGAASSMSVGSSGRSGTQATSARWTHHKDTTRRRNRSKDTPMRRIAIDLARPPGARARRAAGLRRCRDLRRARRDDRGPARDGVPVQHGLHRPVSGTRGDDVIVGTAPADTIDGAGGNDVICGLEGGARWRAGTATTGCSAASTGATRRRPCFELDAERPCSSPGRRDDFVRPRPRPGARDAFDLQVRTRSRYASRRTAVDVDLTAGRRRPRRSRARAPTRSSVVSRPGRRRAARYRRRLPGTPHGERDHVRLRQRHHQWRGRLTTGSFATSPAIDVMVMNAPEDADRRQRSTPSTG